jgi:hypothetical protein
VSLQDWLKNNRRVKHRTSAEEIASLLAIVERDLSNSQVAGYRRTGGSTSLTTPDEYGKARVLDRDVADELHHAFLNGLRLRDNQFVHRKLDGVYDHDAGEGLKTHAANSAGAIRPRSSAITRGID